MSVDGYAYLVRYSQGEVVESSDPKPVPEGLLHTGEQAQNDLRLVCEPSPNAGRMNLHLLLDGTEVTNAESTGTGAGHVGLFVASNSGTSEFTFSDFVVRKPKG